MATRSIPRRQTGSPPTILPPCAAESPHRKRREGYLHPEQSTVRRPFPVLQECVDVVVRQPGSETHVSGLDSKRLSSRSVLLVEKGCTKQFVQGGPKRESAGPALALDPLHHVIVQRYSGSDAHDAIRIA